MKRLPEAGGRGNGEGELMGMGVWGNDHTVFKLDRSRGCVTCDYTKTIELHPLNWLIFLVDELYKR